MKLTTQLINCREVDPNSKRIQPFNVVKYTFYYESDDSDKTLIQKITNMANDLARKVNPNAANNSSQKRDFGKILNNCTAGLMAEFVWRDYLNQNQLVVSETPFDKSSNQIDLAVIRNSKKIEVRSSFPRNGIEFAICNNRYEFDIIGPYANTYKPNEIQKDYYVRALFHLKETGKWLTPDGRTLPLIEKVIDKIKLDGFEVFLTGGATWEMMVNNHISLDKDFLPDYELDIRKIGQKSVYRVVPFSRALDTLEIATLITNEAK